MYPIIVHPHKIKNLPNYSLIYLEKEKNIYTIPVNQTGAFILSLCNGSNTINNIIEKTCRKYGEKIETASKMVEEFISYSIKIGTLSLSEEKKSIDIHIIGDGSYWIPTMVVLELTHRCNLKCVHCYLNAGQNITLSKKLLNKICNEIINLGVDIVQLTGGEPMLHDNFFEIVKVLYNNNIKVIVTTNGTIESKKIYEAIHMIKKMNGRIQVSLDGFKETHNRIRGNIDCFDKTISFITNLITMQIPVDIATCIIDQSFDEIEKLCQYLKDIGIKKHRISFISEQGRAVKNNLKINNKIVNDILNFKKYLQDKFNTLDFEVTGFEEDIFSKIKGISNCGAGYNILKISADGFIHPCPMINLPIEHVQNISLKDYLKYYSCYFQQLVSPSKEHCNNCKNQNLCNNCIAQGLIYYHKVKNCSWFIKNKQLFDIFIYNNT